jgi:RNA polymerase sigma-70 factor (ECF subfamily)
MEDRLRSDEDLAREAVAATDPQQRRRAAEELLGRYKRPVYLWCFRHTRQHEDALDLAQDVLLKAYQKLDSYQGQSRFSTWLFVLTRNTCLSAWRRYKPQFEDESELASLADPARSPEQLLLEREGEDALLRTIHATLEPMEQRALWLRTVEQLPVESITETLGLTNHSGARGVLQTARRKLRAALTQAEGA